MSGVPILSLVTFLPLVGAFLILLIRDDGDAARRNIRNVALLTVEGENDDISGVGQTKAAQTICTNIPEHMRMHYMQPDVGHYGVFNGSRFRREIAPRIVQFAKTHGKGQKATPVKRVIKGGKAL